MPGVFHQNQLLQRPPTRQGWPSPPPPQFGPIDDDTAGVIAPRAWVFVLCFVAMPVLPEVRLGFAGPNGEKPTLLPIMAPNLPFPVSNWSNFRCVT